MTVEDPNPFGGESFPAEDPDSPYDASEGPRPFCRARLSGSIRRAGGASGGFGTVPGSGGRAPSLTERAPEGVTSRCRRVSMDRRGECHSEGGSRRREPEVLEDPSLDGRSGEQGDESRWRENHRQLTGAKLPRSSRSRRRVPARACARARARQEDRPPRRRGRTRPAPGRRGPPRSAPDCPRRRAR